MLGARSIARAPNDNSANLLEQPVERSVALVHALLHSRLDHPVAILGRVEETGRDQLRTTVAEILESCRLESDVTGHAVPLECLNHALRRHDFAVATLEAMHSLRPVLDETPVSPALHFHSLDHELVATSPPLCDELRIGHRLPYSLPRRVEDALDANLAIPRRRDDRACCGLLRRCAHGAPFVRSRKASSRLRRSFSIRWYISIQSDSSSRRRGPRRALRTRPTFFVVTSPASSRRLTCFFIPVSVMPNLPARSVMDASPRPSRTRIPRRVGSESAANVLSSRGVY